MRRKSDSTIILLFVFVGLPIFFFQKIAEVVNPSIIVLILVLIALVFIFSRIASAKKRERLLLEKYKDTQIVEKILARCFWQGQSSEQLLDSLGQPEDIDQKIMKTKNRETWKYNPRGTNRYGLRITLDNDVVVGWDKKD